MMLDAILAIAALVAALVYFLVARAHVQRLAQQRDARYRDVADSFTSTSRKNFSSSEGSEESSAEYFKVATPDWGGFNPDFEVAFDLGSSLLVNEDYSVQETRALDLVILGGANKSKQEAIEELYREYRKRAQLGMQNPVGHEEAQEEVRHGDLEAAG